MPKERITKDLWNFPGGFSDWVNKGKKILKVVENFEGKKYEEKTQIKILKALRREGLTKAKMYAKNPAVSSRKILNSLAKVNLIDYSSGNLQITKLGEDLINSKTLEEIKISLRRACENIMFWNPTEKDMNRDFDVNPYVAVLRLLIDLGYLSKLEIENYVIKIKNNVEIQKVLNEIKDLRLRNRKLRHLSIDEQNRAGWMMSLFGDTDLINHSKGMLFLNDERMKTIFSIVEVEFELPKKVFEEPIEKEIEKEMEKVKAEDLDKEMGLQLKEDSKIITGTRKDYIVQKFKRKVGAKQRIKMLYDFKCQICGLQIKKPGWKKDLSRKEAWSYLYAETEHIKPISKFPELDIPENMLCLCPNCHIMLDCNSIEIFESKGSFYCKDVIENRITPVFVKKEHMLKLF
jgi:hypothetical protein